MRHLPVMRVARELGMRAAPARGASGGAIFGCPACGSERRHASRRDPRGAIGVRRDGRGWCCHSCEVTGDVLDLVAFQLGGARLRDLNDHRRAEVRAWCERLVGQHSSTLPQRSEELGQPAPAEYPPIGEVHALWGGCGRVDLDPSAAKYLAARGLDPTVAADRDLARALRSAELPRWARAWSREHRLIVPLFDASGALRSLLARSVDRSATIKSLAPQGYSRAGLVLADTLGRQLLQHGLRPCWWPASHELRVVVAEGEIDWLTAATLSSEADEWAPAVLGVVSGAWTLAIAARIPDGCSVLVATDNDEAGNKYARHICESLRERNVDVERWSAS